MAITALGPTNAGGMQPIVEEGYELTYYPDVMNAELQLTGNAPVFYYVPKRLSMARRGGTEDGDFLFNLIRFAGVQSADTTVGVTGEASEVAGGVLTFSVTGAAPDHVLTTSQQKIIDRFTASGDHFWGIRTREEPIFRPVIITSNITSITNLSPLPDGSVPGAEPRSMRDGRRDGLAIRAYSVPPLAVLPKSVSASRDGSADTNLSAWYWHVQGQGNGSIDPTGTHAYSALVGAYPASILWAGFHGAYSPINVWMNIKIKFWTPQIKITIDGHWDRIFEHFSAAASGRYLWASADIKAEFNKMRTNGTIVSKILVDPTIPGGEAIAEKLEKKSDLVFDKFMAAAQKMIFEQPQPQVEAAQASSGNSLFSPWGVGVGLKYRRDTTQLNLHFEEERQIAFLQDDQISGTMEGMFEAMKADPGAERKYFLSVYLEDWPRRLGRIFRPVVNWPQPANNWVGQPVAFAAVQVGYPNTNGEIMWTGHSFTASDPADSNWNFSLTQKQLSDVANPPADWTPDKTFIKRSIHLMEPPDPAENPFVRVQIDQNEILLDDEDANGRLMNDTIIEVRADSAGKLMVGPITLNIELTDDKQIVEVTFEPTDENGQLVGREPVRFVWKYVDQAEPRFWSIFTGDVNFRAFFTYQVRVIIKGTLFSAGMEWTGPKERASVNGPLMVRVPMQNEAGVVSRALPLTALTSRLPVEAGGAPPPMRAREMAAQPAAYRSEAALEVGGYRLGGMRAAPPAMPGSAAGRPTEAPPARITGVAGAPPPSSGRPVSEGLELEIQPGKEVVGEGARAYAGKTAKAPSYFEEEEDATRMEYEGAPPLRQATGKKSKRK